MVVVDVAFAATVGTSISYEQVTLPFITALGARLAAWVDHHEEVVSTNLISKTSGWYLGTNVPGKPRRVLSYTGGVGTYRQKCADEAAADYPGFLIK